MDTLNNIIYIIYILYMYLISLENQGNFFYIFFEIYVGPWHIDIPQKLYL